MSKVSATGQTPVRQHPRKPQETVKQLSLQLEAEAQIPTPRQTLKSVTLTQLYDAGITKQGMSIRVKLKQERARQLCRDYVNRLEISDRGTIIYEGNEFNKPSSLATKINGSAAGGWNYVEAKVNGQWVRLDQLRQIWRQY